MPETPNNKPKSPPPHAILDEAMTAGAAAVVASGAIHPTVAVAAVVDPAVLDQAQVFAELRRQTQPMADAGTSAAGRLAETIREGTALPKGVSLSTAERYVASSRSPEALLGGANPTGKAAEVVATADYRAMHRGQATDVVNPPEHVARNVADIRLAPDPSSRKDLLFAFETPQGQNIWKYNGQVKTGGPGYIADSLIEMAQTPGYGKVGYVDARLVNSDGTPKVGHGAFTEGQARRLTEAKVLLRGIRDLESRAEALLSNAEATKADGLDPLAREELRLHRDDIATAYRPRGVAGRIGGGAALGAASAAVLSLVVQLATEGKIDSTTVGRAAGTGAAFGAGGAVADAGLYHFASKALGMAPEAAKTFAQQWVAVGFCVVAIGTDVISEVRAARSGEISTAGAVSGTAMKTALDLLPLLMGPLGLAGLPLLVGAQFGGRWVIAKAREADRVIALAVDENSAKIRQMDSRVTAAVALSDEIDRIYAEAMGGNVRGAPVLHLVKPT